MKVALAQLNTTIGDFDGNLAQIRAAMARAQAEGVRLLVCPELSLCGYPPLDLLDRRAFYLANERALATLAAETGEVRVLVGFAERRQGTSPGPELYNAAALLGDGQVLAIRRKVLLPTYDVFDEARYFASAPPEEATPIVIDGLPLGVTLCEDIWNDPTFWPHQRYVRDPVEELVSAGAKAIVNLSASPFHGGKPAVRRALIQGQARRHGVPVLYCNLTGGNDELIFEGGSMLADAQGRLVHIARRFDEDFVVQDLFAPGEARMIEDDEVADTEAALVLGVKDYCRKCGFKKAVLGLSGGIDSAVVAAIAVKALGRENVTGIGMPSRYSSEGSVTDARALADALGIEFQVVPIEGPFAAMVEALTPMFAGTTPDVTEENLQARLRGMILMAHSNKFGHLLLTTGNKSELAVGYCTLYGDMSGGLAVISDLPKQRVYALARYLNRDGVVIPESTLTKPPSAELRPGQTDQDSLPPYDVLDDILVRYVEKGELRDEIVAAGHDPAVVAKVLGLVDRTEYKRRQAAPGLKVTAKAFGLGRRIPIAQRFRG